MRLASSYYILPSSFLFPHKTSPTARTGEFAVLAATMLNPVLLLITCLIVTLNGATAQLMPMDEEPATAGSSSGGSGEPMSTFSTSCSRGGEGGSGNSMDLQGGSGDCGTPPMTTPPPSTTSSLATSSPTTSSPTTAPTTAPTSTEPTLPRMCVHVHLV